MTFEKDREVEDRVLAVLDRVLQLEGRSAHFTSTTRLHGDLPEFDSMAAVEVITGLEDEFGLLLEDDELTGDVFETVGSVTRFVASRMFDS